MVTLNDVEQFMGAERHPAFGLLYIFTYQGSYREG